MEQLIYDWQVRNFSFVFLCCETTLWTLFWLELLCRYRFWRENMKITSEQLFSLEKWWKITWRPAIYLFSGKQWGFLGLFQVPVKNALVKNMVRTCVFKKIRNICYILGGNARNKCFTSKYWQSNIQQISVKYLSFSHPYISLMTNDLALIKL